MITTAVKTHKITTTDKDILRILDRYMPRLAEGSIVAIASKIVAITEGRFQKPRRMSWLQKRQNTIFPEKKISTAS